MCIQNVRLFGVYDVRWPFLAEIHTAPLKRFVPSSVLQAVRALRNAPAALAVFLAGVAPVITWTKMSFGVTKQRWVKTKHQHWKPRVVIMRTLSSLVTPEVVVMTTWSVTIDDKFRIMTILNFQWNCLSCASYDIPQTCIFSQKERLSLTYRHWREVVI